MARPKKENKINRVDMRIYVPERLSEDLQLVADFLGVPKNGAALLAMHQWTKEFIESKWTESEEECEDGTIIGIRKNEITGEEHFFTIHDPNARFNKEQLTSMAQFLLMDLHEDECNLDTGRETGE
jgi:hypothetical protein